MVLYHSLMQHHMSHEWDFQQCGMWNQQRLRPACTYAQTDQSLCCSLEYSMIVKLLTAQTLEFLSLTRGCTGSSESTLVKMPHCWKSHKNNDNRGWPFLENLRLHNFLSCVIKDKLPAVALPDSSFSWQSDALDATNSLYSDSCRAVRRQHITSSTETITMVKTSNFWA